jgi:hypothetical protein
MYNAPFGKHLRELQVALPRLSTTFKDVWRKKNFTLDCGNTSLVSPVKGRSRNDASASRQKEVTRLMWCCEKL